MIGFLLPLLMMQKAPILLDPTYRELGKLVGGSWEGSAGPAVVRQHFTYAVDGKMIRGEGTVTVKGKVVLRTQANFGWDPVLKSVTYVDFHDHDTVYMGHVVLEKGWMVYDFREFADSSKKFLAKSHFLDGSHYEFLLGDEKIALSRKR